MPLNLIIEGKIKILDVVRQRKRLKIGLRNKVTKYEHCKKGKNESDRQPESFHNQIKTQIKVRKTANPLYLFIKIIRFLFLSICSFPTAIAINNNITTSATNISSAVPDSSINNNFISSSSIKTISVNNNETQHQANNEIKVSSDSNEIILPTEKSSLVETPDIRNIINDDDDKTNGTCKFCDPKTGLPYCQVDQSHNNTPKIPDFFHESRINCLSMFRAFQCQEEINHYDNLVNQTLAHPESKDWQLIQECRPFWHYGVCWSSLPSDSGISNELVADVWFDEDGKMIPINTQTENNRIYNMLTYRVYRNLPKTHSSCLVGSIYRDCRIIISEKERIIKTTWDVTIHTDCVKKKKEVLPPCDEMDGSNFESNSTVVSEIEEMPLETESLPQSLLSEPEVEVKQQCITPPWVQQNTQQQQDYNYPDYSDYPDQDDGQSPYQPSQEEMEFYYYTAPDCRGQFDRINNVPMPSIKNHESLPDEILNGTSFGHLFTHCGPSKEEMQKWIEENKKLKESNLDTTDSTNNFTPNCQANTTGQVSEAELTEKLVKTSLFLQRYDYILRTIQTIATSGALLMLLCLRKLHCTRIYIHMNLLLSFIIRAILMTFLEKTNPDLQILNRRDQFYDFLDKYPFYNEADPNHMAESIFDQNYQTMLAHDYHLNTTFLKQYKDIHFSIIEHTKNIYWDDGGAAMITIDEHRMTYGDTPGFDAISDILWDHCPFMNNYQKSYFPCNAISFFLQYAITANYFWLLVEGIYLYLLLRTHSVRGRYTMLPFLLMGWGISIIPCICWAIAMALSNYDTLELTGNQEGNNYQFSYCWMESQNENVRTYNFIIQIPIVMTLVANAYIFINVISVVNIKLRAGQQSDYKQRLARSTLSLIPLLGIQYLGVVYLEKQDWDNDNLSGTNHVFILTTGIIKSTFNRVPGILVSLFYCFCNNEVKKEFMSKIEKYETSRELELDAMRRRSTISQGALQQQNSLRNYPRASFNSSMGDMQNAQAYHINSQYQPKGSFSGSISGSIQPRNTNSIDQNMPPAYNPQRSSSVFGSGKLQYLRSFLYPLTRSSKSDNRRSSTYTQYTPAASHAAPVPINYPPGRTGSIIMNNSSAQAVKRGSSSFNMNLSVSHPAGALQTRNASQKEGSGIELRDIATGIEETNQRNSNSINFKSRIQSSHSNDARKHLLASRLSSNSTPDFEKDQNSDNRLRYLSGPSTTSNPPVSNSNSSTYNNSNNRPHSMILGVSSASDNRENIQNRRASSQLKAVRDTPEQEVVEEAEEEITGSNTNETSSELTPLTMDLVKNDIKKGLKNSYNNLNIRSPSRNSLEILRESQLETQNNSNSTIDRNETLGGLKNESEPDSGNAEECSSMLGAPGDENRVSR